MHDVIVIGGGLTGLIAFRHLAAAELDVLLLEARPRVLASASRCFLFLSLS
jgi:flavin-dependent dehydrogenase